MSHIIGSQHFFVSVVRWIYKLVHIVIHNDKGKVFVALCKKILPCRYLSACQPNFIPMCLYSTPLHYRLAE